MTQTTTSKAKKLKDMLPGGTLEFLMEAHNGLTAKIVERTGFKGIWANYNLRTAVLAMSRNFCGGRGDMPSR